MFNFNLKQSDIYLAIKWAWAFRLISFFKNLLFVLFISIFSIFSYGLFLGNFSEKTSKFLLGLSIISFVLFLVSLIKETFFNSKIKNPQPPAQLSEVIRNPEKYNLAQFLSFETARAVKKSLNFSRPRGVSSTHLFYFLLAGNSKVNFVFSRLLLDLKEVKKTVKEKLVSQKNYPLVFYKNFQNAISEALKIAQKKNHSRIEMGDILTALAVCDPIFKRILIDFKLKVEDIENLTWWLENIQRRREKEKRFWEYENLVRKGTLAKEWTAGYTINLDKYSIDLTDLIKKRPPEIIGHQKEIELTERILARSEINNALIIGKPGTGRKSIIYAIAKKSLFGQSLGQVNYKRVVELNMASLLAEVKSIDEAETALDKVFQEAASAGNIILVINDFHNYIGQSPRPGAIDISAIIANYLKLPQLQIIAVTSYDGLHRYIEKNTSLLSLFEKVEVSEISSRETLMLLENLTPSLERKYKKLISYPAIREVVSLADRYLPSLSFPEKAVRILEEVVIYVNSTTKDKVVLPKHVAEVITEKTEIPVGEIKVKERKILLNLEQLIHQRIINQDEAVKEVSTALRRARAEVTIRKGSMGAFLFLGPTGVGKTETSKALAEIYFGSEKTMIRLDMSEFQTTRDIPRLIGSFEEKGLLITPVRENPFSLILLDEIEKTHPNILNLFLQVLDEGYLTDGLGRKVDFRNTLIIATSNAGYKVILKALKEKTRWTNVKQKLLDYLFAKRVFRPEFINRFDAFVVFRPLSSENLLDIADLMLKKLKKNLKEKGIEFSITKPLKEKIVELGYNPVFGAREMRRIIQDRVENVLALAFLKNELKRGDRVRMDSEFKLIIN